MSFTKLFLMGLAGSIYETVTGQNHTQRLVRRKLSNLIHGESRRSWQDSRTKRVSALSDDECERLNHEAARSI